LALFPRKKSDDEPDDAFIPQPEKARKWFEHANTQIESGQCRTAIIYYATGIAFDPACIDGHAGMLQAAIGNRQANGKRLSRGDLKNIGGHADMIAFAVAEALWMSDLENGGLAVKAIQAAATAGQFEAGVFLAPHVLGIVSHWKKMSKGPLVAVRDACSIVGAWDEAMTAGQLALEQDPSDAALDASIKDLSAQRAMSKGGYEEAAGEEGGFRSFVKDMDKQRALEEDESIAGVGGGGDRVLARAKAAFKEAPEVPENVNKFGNLLRRAGDERSLKMAEEVFMRGHETTGEYRFRMAAGDIRIQRFRNRLRRMQETGDDAKMAQLKTQLLDFESKEFTERSERYPTDRHVRFQLGEIARQRGDTETAMGCYQKAKDEPRLRSRAGHRLGLCFATEGWHAEAVAEFREVLSRIDATESDLELEVRYDLMLALIEASRLDKSEELAREALDICSGIARKDITYKDIRERRREIDDLVRSL
jgi:tetratricopeptide (TPR) repeat protein